MSDRARLPLAHPRHGSLPLLLLGLTLVTGVIDAVSLLVLGRVFVANMTGNVIITGFALAGVPEFSLVTSVGALVAFLVGAAAAGVFVDRIADRGVLLRAVVAVEWVLLAACLVAVLVWPPRPGSLPTVAVAVVAAAAMGMQNAAARRIGVPDLNTSVVSMSMVGLAADHGHAPREAVFRRLLAVCTLLVGAVVGAVLVRSGGAAPAFTLILVLLAAVGAAAHVLLRRGPDWEA